MRKVYDKPWLEVVEFKSEVIMTADENEDVIFSLGEEAVEDGGEY